MTGKPVTAAFGEALTRLRALDRVGRCVGTDAACGRSVAATVGRKPMVASVGVGVGVNATPSTTVTKTVVAPARSQRNDEIDRDRLALCVHEAGHAVAGVLIGGQLVCSVVGADRVRALATGMADDGATGLTQFVDNGITRLAHSGINAFSGPLAEARWRAGRRPSLSEVDVVLAYGSGRHCDREVMRADGLMPSDVRAEVSGLLDRAWPAVQTVAKRLYLNVEVQHKHVLAALGVPYDDRAAFALNNIRAGMRRVPGFR